MCCYHQLTRELSDGSCQEYHKFVLPIGGKAVFRLIHQHKCLISHRIHKILESRFPVGHLRFVLLQSAFDKFGTTFFITYRFRNVVHVQILQTRVIILVYQLLPFTIYRFIVLPTSQYPLEYIIARDNTSSPNSLHRIFIRQTESAYLYVIIKKSTPIV